MRKLYFVFLFIIPNMSSAQGGIFIGSNFWQLSDTEYKIKSFFSAGSGGQESCFPIQFRYERTSSDTVYLELLYETRYGMPSLGCSRYDTMDVTGNYSGTHYVNVSTGIVRFGDTPEDSIILWHMYDSTFEAILALPQIDLSELTFMESTDGSVLSITGVNAVQSTLYDINGRILAISSGNEMVIGTLPDELYFIHVVTESGLVYRRKWMKTE